MEAATLHGMWAAVAPAWGEHAEYAEARGAGVTERMLELAAPGPGDRVLELACGPGGLGLAVAPRVADIVMSDVAAEMAAIAAERAAAIGLTNVRTRVLDFEAIEQPDERFDVVLCRDGLMFATDPARAVAEMHRVLRPGGRLALAVWGPRELNPWLGVVFDAVAAEIGRPVPPPGIPGPFSLGNLDALGPLLAAAGFTDVTVGELDVPLRAPSFDAWWHRTAALAGPLSMILASLPEPAKDAIEERLRESTAAYATPSGMDFPGVAVIAGARRPD